MKRYRLREWKYCQKILIYVIQKRVLGIFWKRVPGGPYRFTDATMQMKSLEHKAEMQRESLKPQARKKR